MSAHAEPAVVYDMGGEFDKSFNEATYRGIERWKRAVGKPYLEFEIANETQREQVLRRMAGHQAGQEAALLLRPARSVSSAAWTSR